MTSTIRGSRGWSWRPPGQLPPDGETPGGVGRRALLSQALLLLLGEEGSVPSADRLHRAAQLWELLALPAGSPDRRAIEERTWALVARGRPNAALRALADLVGFAPHPTPSPVSGTG